ncbi:hypothetical protein [Ferruginibacter sp. SUN106]|uniref:hypothetical protein n=1 Tax=Ferruginibacter sp. SUN106 TaxID=2978348 RepID=UPI003D363DB3
MHHQKNKLFLKALSITILFFCNYNSNAQAWIKSTDNNSWYIHRQFFHSLKSIIKGVDSNMYVITSHRPDSYWEKKNEGKSELLVSRIDEKGNISFVTILSQYANRPVLKAFNNKYYLLDKELQNIKKEFYRNCFVYTAKWELESQFKIDDLPHQSGFTDFTVDKEGSVFVLTAPYFIDHKQQDFKGAYLVKYSSDGAMLNKVLFDKCYLSDLTIAGDSIHFLAQQQKLVYPYYNTDSLLEISSDKDLNYSVTAREKLIPKDKKTDREVLLADGGRVVFIDSTYALSQNSWTSVFKISLLDKQRHAIWTIEPSNRWFYLKPKPLSNGNFITQVDKRWDSTCLVLFDKAGNQRTIKSFVMNADTRIDRYSFVDYFEINNNEIWLFYKKESPSREEELYFERILL